MVSISSESVSSEEQLARFKLRETFLRALNEFHNEPCSITTYEKTSQNATFVGWKKDGKEVLVKEFITPTSLKLDSSLLRTPDILAIQFVRSLQLP